MDSPFMDDMIAVKEAEEKTPPMPLA